MESLLSLLYYGYRDFTFCSLIFAQKFKNPNCLKHAKCSWAILKPKKIIFLCSICETAYETTLWKAWQVYNTCIKLIFHFDLSWLSYQKEFHDTEKYSWLIILKLYFWFTCNVLFNLLILRENFCLV